MSVIVGLPAISHRTGNFPSDHGRGTAGNMWGSMLLEDLWRPVVRRKGLLKGRLQFFGITRFFTLSAGMFCGWVARGEEGLAPHFIVASFLMIFFLVPIFSKSGYDPVLHKDILRRDSNKYTIKNT